MVSPWGSCQRLYGWDGELAYLFLVGVSEVNNRSSVDETHWHSGLASSGILFLFFLDDCRLVVFDDSPLVFFDDRLVTPSPSYSLDLSFSVSPEFILTIDFRLRNANFLVFSYH